MSINLPVSIGEAIDKLIILDIKLNKIQNPDKLKYIQSDYDDLHSLVKPYIDNNKFYYSVLYKINQKIYDVQDDLRLSIDERGNNSNNSNNCNNCNNCNESYKMICDENDRRCRIKNKINSKAQSNTREQKGYTVKRAIICTHLGLGDMICMIGIVRYLSTAYDQVTVVVKERYLNNVKLFYEDDDTIKFCVVDDQFTGTLKHGAKLGGNTTAYSCGYHSLHMEHIDYLKCLPDIFYSQMGFDYSTALEYFYVDTSKYENDPVIKDIISRDYYFVHDVATTDDKKISERLLEANKDALIINPKKNIYKKNTEFYDIISTLQNKPLVYFIPIIINARQIHCIDSSFFNLINYLDTSKAEKIVAYPRNNHTYPSFTKFEYIYEK